MLIVSTPELPLAIVRVEGALVMLMLPLLVFVVVEAVKVRELEAAR